MIRLMVQIETRGTDDAQPVLSQVARLIMSGFLTDQGQTEQGQYWFAITGRDDIHELTTRDWTRMSDGRFSTRTGTVLPIEQALLSMGFYGTGLDSEVRIITEKLGVQDLINIRKSGVPRRVLVPVDRVGSPAKDPTAEEVVEFMLKKMITDALPGAPTRVDAEFWQAFSPSQSLWMVTVHA